MPEEALVFLVFVTLVGGIWLLTPVTRALAERIKGRTPGLEPGGREELRRLRDETADEVNQLRREVAELGERVDFAERLLAKQREAERLPRGS